AKSTGSKQHRHKMLGRTGGLRFPPADTNEALSQLQASAFAGYGNVLFSVIKQERARVKRSPPVLPSAGRRAPCYRGVAEASSTLTQDDSDIAVGGIVPTRASNVCGDTFSDGAVIQRDQPGVGTTPTQWTDRTELPTSGCR